MIGGIGNNFQVAQLEGPIRDSFGDIGREIALQGAISASTPQQALESIEKGLKDKKFDKDEVRAALDGAINERNTSAQDEQRRTNAQFVKDKLFPND